MKKFTLWVLLFLVQSTAVYSADFRLPSPQMETLPNGLTIAWFLDNQLPIVDMAVMVKSGSRDDLSGKSGTSELLSVLLQRGSDGLSAVEMSKRVERLGASAYASTDDDAMSVGVHGLSQDASILLDLMSKIILKPNFSPDEFAREKDRMKDQWSHLGDSAEALASFVFSRMISNGTSYGRGSVKNLKELNSLQRSDLLQFYKDHFTPKNSILMVVGKVNRTDFKNQILSLFGDWKGSAQKKNVARYSDPKFSLKKGEIVVVNRPDLPQAQVRLGFHIPSIYSKNRYALSVANALLGEYFNSRLNSVIRDQMGLAYGISSNLSYSKDIAYLSISSATQSSNIGKLIHETTKTLKELKSGKVSEEEVLFSKEYMLGGYPLSVSTLGAVATRWLGGYVYDLGPDYLNEFIPRVSTVGRKDVIQAIQEAFHLNEMVIVVSGDAKEIIPALKASGYRSIKQVNSAGLM